jgi:hypothetical protein
MGLLPLSDLFEEKRKRVAAELTVGEYVKAMFLP